MWNSRDEEAMRAGLHPDVILRTPEGWPEPGPYVGREAVLRQWRQFRETWDGDAMELVGDVVQVGDRVAARAIWRGAGRGPQQNLELTYHITIRDGTVIAIEEFWDHQQALDALGAGAA
jgi:ketosteroid isomerase-like protein